MNSKQITEQLQVIFGKKVESDFASTTISYIRRNMSFEGEMKTAIQIEDIFQESVLAFLDNKKKNVQIDDNKSFFFGIIKNTCFNYLKKSTIDQKRYDDSGEEKNTRITRTVSMDNDPNNDHKAEFSQKFDFGNGLKEIYEELLFGLFQPSHKKSDTKLSLPESIVLIYNKVMEFQLDQLEQFTKASDSALKKIAADIFNKTKRITEAAKYAGTESSRSGRFMLEKFGKNILLEFFEGKLRPSLNSTQYTIDVTESMIFIYHFIMSFTLEVLSQHTKDDQSTLEQKAPITLRKLRTILKQN